MSRLWLGRVLSIGILLCSVDTSHPDQPGLSGYQIFTTFCLFCVLFLCVSATELRSKSKCREAERESVTIIVQKHTKRKKITLQLYGRGQPAFRCITTIFYDKATAKGKEIEIIQEMLFSQHYHMYYEHDVNIQFFKIMFIVNNSISRHS